MAITITTDESRAHQVFSTLVAMFKRRQYPYNRYTEPQEHQALPPTLQVGSATHALFLFQACNYMRGGINSNDAMKRLGLLYQECPWFFNPRELEKEETVPGEITALLILHGLGSNANEIGQHWIFNSRKLSLFWGSDPRRLFDSVRTYDQACERLIRRGKPDHRKPNGFLGFGHKMVSMLIHFFLYEQMIKPLDEPFPPAVDFHLLRILLEHSIIVVSQENESEKEISSSFYYEKVTSVARKLLVHYCTQTGTDPLELGAALWIYSRALCRLHPGNGASRGRYQARKTEIEPVEVTWNIPQTRRFDRSCYGCPIRTTCTLHISAAYYYVQGKITPRKRVLDPHPGTYLPFDDGFDTI